MIGHVYVADVAAFRSWRALGLDTRLAACLSRASITPERSAAMDDDDLLGIRNVGIGSVRAIRAAVPHRPLPAVSAIVDEAWTVIA